MVIRAPLAAFWRRWKRLIFWGTVTPFLLFSFWASTRMIYYYERAQSIDLSGIGDVNTTNQFFDRYGREIGRLFIEDRLLLTHDEIPDNFRLALMAAEDRRFYKHGGIDSRGILRAAVQNVRAGKMAQGGSTISQQLSKHVLGKFERTLDRKILEAFLALRIEGQYTKSEILDLYANRIYFGSGYFGLGAAARGYFDKKPMELTVDECALLAGVIRAPTSGSPRRNAEKAKVRRDLVLEVLATEGHLTAQASSLLKSRPVKVVASRSSGINSYFMAKTMDELQEILSLNDEEGPQGLRVTTTIDEPLQRIAEFEVRRNIESMRKNPANPIPDLQGACVMLDSKSGGIRALVGGSEFSKTPFDRATMAYRDVGTALHPLLYAMAFEQMGFSPATLMNASAIEPGTKPDQWGPLSGSPAQNPAAFFITIQDALATGNFSTARRLFNTLGPAQVSAVLTKVGLENPQVQKNGTVPLNLITLCSLFQTFSNEGQYLKPHIIEKVVTQEGEVLYNAKPESRVIFQPMTAQQVSLTLKQALSDGTAGGSFLATTLPSAVVGMSGISEGMRDTLFVGYSPEALVTAVWLGRDDGGGLGTRAHIRDMAVPLWVSLMSKALVVQPGLIEYPAPEGLQKYEVNRYSGKVRGLALLAPQRNGVVCYLTKDQVSKAQSLATDENAAPEGWSARLTSMILEGELKGPTDQSTFTRTGIPPVLEMRVPGVRGQVITSDGAPLAHTVQTYDLVLSWPSTDVAPTAALAVAWVKKQVLVIPPILPRAKLPPDSFLEQLYVNRRFEPVTVVENLTRGQIDSYYQTKLNAVGFGLRGKPTRAYPGNAMFAHGIGYLRRTQKPNDGIFVAREVVQDSFAGATGIEQMLDEELAGQEGTFQIATTPDGFTRSASITKTPKPGAEVTLTIDSKLQASLEKALAKRQASAGVIIDIATGDVLAMASLPSFNPNEFLPALPPQKWKTLTSDSQKPLLNRAMQLHYPPGSIFKVVTALAAMRAGVFDPTRTVNCPGYFQVGNVTYNLPKERGVVSFNTALAYSYNTYFFDLGLRTGKEFLFATAREVGLGQPTGIILPGEVEGRVPTAEFVRKTHKRTLGPGDVTNASIGQGDVLVTPLQMARVMAMLASNGKLFHPRLVKQVRRADGSIQVTPVKVDKTVTFATSDLARLREGMVSVSEMGTGSAVRFKGIRVAAKTGTAQVGTKASPKSVAWMSGYLPADKPKYAFTVMTEGAPSEDIGGGKTVGPLLRETFLPWYPGALESEAEVKPDSEQANPDAGERGPDEYLIE